MRLILNVAYVVGIVLQLLFPSIFRFSWAPPTVLFASDYNSEIAALRMFVKVSTEKSIRLVKRSLEKLFVTDATHLRKVFYW